MKMKKYVPAIASLLIYSLILVLYLLFEGEKPVLRVNLENYFSAAKITNGIKYFNQRVLISLASLFLKLAVFYLLYRFEFFKRLYNKYFSKIKKSFLKSIVYTSFLLFVSAVLVFPLSYISLVHLKSYGIVHTPFWLFLKDYAVSNAVFIIFASLIISLFILIYLRCRKYFSIITSAATFVFAVILMIVYPLFISPLFNDFKKLDNSVLESKIKTLLMKDGIRVKNFYVVNASIRTKGANAYVSGLGPTKEIVIYDNLIRDYTHDEILSIVAHESGHYKMNHIWIGLLVMPVSNPFALFAFFSFLGFIIDKKREKNNDVSFHIPYVFFLLIIFIWLINPVINAASRRMERDADYYSLKLTSKPKAFISTEVKLYSKYSFYNYDPNIVYKILYFSHPPVKERIEMAKGYEKLIN